MRLSSRGSFLHFTSNACGRLLPHPYSSCLAPNISVREHWYGIDQSLVTAASGDSLQIFGAGFDIAATFAYSCMFRGKFTSQTVEGAVTSHDCVTCRMPADTVEEREIQVSLLHNEQPLQRLAIGM